MSPYGSLGADIEFLEISKPGRPSHTQLDLEIWKSRKITLRAQISRNGPKFPDFQKWAQISRNGPCPLGPPWGALVSALCSVKV